MKAPRILNKITSCAQLPARIEAETGTATKEIHKEGKAK